VTFYAGQCVRFNSNDFRSNVQTSVIVEKDSSNAYDVAIELLTIPYLIHIDNQSPRISFGSNVIISNAEINQRLFREGIFFEIQYQISKFDSDFFIQYMLNNHFSPDNTYISSPVVIPMPQPSFPYQFNIESEHFLEGRRFAEVKMRDFINHVYTEIHLINNEHFDNDMRKWRNKGKKVPNSEIKKRISKAPHLQALILLQEKMCNSAIVL
jgi:hypothetical protein